MEANVVHDDVEIEEEYVLLDLDSVPAQFGISPDAPYVLSGLETLNPILVIDNKLKLILPMAVYISSVLMHTHGMFLLEMKRLLFATTPMSYHIFITWLYDLNERVGHRIGHYEETIGTCIAFTEEGTSPIVPEKTGPSEANKSSGKSHMDPNQCPSEQVKPVACINKILKFKLLVDTNVPNPSAQA